MAGLRLPGSGARSGIVGVFLVVLGLALIGGSAAYFAYSHFAREGLDELNYSVPTGPGGQGPDSPAQDPELGAPSATPTGTSPEPGSSLPSGAIYSQRLYPGEQLQARFWKDPSSYRPPVVNVSALLEGFQPVDWRQLPPVHTLPRPTRLIIPAIAVDSVTAELKIEDLGDSRSYETPKFVVGHIPETANPGELGTAWFFGHLESPIRDEGSVFRRLPEIPAMLRDGEPVHVLVESPQAVYLFQVTATRVVHESALVLHDLGAPAIVLVTCVPRLVYDHRLLVMGELVGVKPKV